MAVFLKSMKKVVKSSRRKVLLRHLQLNHNIQKFPCPMCECTPELQKLCSKNSVGVNWCPMCVYETSNRKDLEEHIKSLHQSNYSSFSASPGNMKYCPDCKYGTAQRSRLMNHRRTVHNRQTFDCPSCGFETTKIYKLFHQF